MSQTKILITDGMAEDGVSILKKNEGFEVDLRKSTSADELAKIIGDYHCIVIRSATTLTGDLLKKASNMKLIVRAGAGVDNIDVKTATELGIPVMNTASANSLAAAEQTIALIFALFRSIPQASQSLKEGRWDRALYKGAEVTGKTLGLIGLGNIGRIVAEKALGLGMNVIAFDPVAKATLSHSNFSQKSQEEVLSKADIISIHVPKTKDTANLINKESLSKMKKGSYLINCARGGIADEKAVVEAVDSGQLSGAAFDVFVKEPPEFPNPLFNHPKIVCTPHLGASTVEAQHRVALTAATQITGFFLKEDKTGIINL